MQCQFNIQKPIYILASKKLISFTIVKIQLMQ